VYLYAFDVASEINTARAAERLAASPGGTRPSRAAPRDVPIPRPLTLEPASGVRLGGAPVRTVVRVHEVGVVSVGLRVAFGRDSLAALAPLHSPVLDDGRPLDALARAHCEDACVRLGDCLIRPGARTEPEAYTVFCLTHLAGQSDANAWLAGRQREVAGLLTETPPERLSEAQVAEVLRLRRSFENSDLVVVDWDAALLVSLDGSGEDTLFVLELANLQLEEFRWMDQSLDRYLDQAYDDLAGRGRWRFGYTAGVLRSLHRMRVDLAKLADEVTHAIKFVGDWHLARVYLLARERFHLDQWRSSVEQRLGELDRLYTMTRGELYDRRMLWLEVVIVVFFAVDLLILMVK
jgi:hypothetical protein